MSPVSHENPVTGAEKPKWTKIPISRLRHLIGARAWRFVHLTDERGRLRSLLEVVKTGHRLEYNLGSGLWIRNLQEKQ
jgi:hypothetical protein